MKVVIYIFLVFLANSNKGNVTPGQDEEALFAEATGELNAGNVDKAVMIYKALLDQGYKNTAVFNNLGVAHYNKNNVGLSILNFERGLLHDPSNKQLLDNVALIRNTKSLAQTFPPHLSLRANATNFMYKFSADQFAGLGIILLSLGTLLIVMSLINKRAYFRYIGVLIILFAFSTHIIAYIKVYSLTHPIKGVIIISTSLRAAPSMLAKEKDQLSEGFTVEVKDSFEGWSKVQFSNEEVGWIPDSTVAYIEQ